MANPFRVVVTGSRHWADDEPVRRALADARLEAGAQGRRLVVIEGGAKGADWAARMWAHGARRMYGELDVGHETWPANWEQLGNHAGPIRNEAMLKAGTDLVLAFPIGDRRTSPGTWDCIERACVRGIPVRVFPKAVARG